MDLLGLAKKLVDNCKETCRTWSYLVVASSEDTASRLFLAIDGDLNNLGVGLPVVRPDGRRRLKILLETKKIVLGEQF